MQSPDQPVRVKLIMVQLHKMQHPIQHTSPEGIRLALPSGYDILHGFAVKEFAHLLVQPECCAYASDAVIAAPLTIVDHKSDPLVGLHKGCGDGIAAYNFCTELDACFQWGGKPILCSKNRASCCMVSPVYTLQRMGRSLPPLRRMRLSIVCCPSVT